VLNRAIQYWFRDFPDAELRYIYNLKFNTDQPLYGNGEILFDWPVNPDSSYLRKWSLSNTSWRINGQDSSWTLSGSVTTPPGEFGVFYFGFSDRVPAEFLFQAAPITYSGRSYKPGIYAEYGFFIQEVHPIWHPPLTTSTNEIITLKSVYPNPFKNHLSFPWDQRMGQLFTVLLYGVDGKLAWSEQVSHTGPAVDIELSDVPSGQYNLVVAPPLQRSFVGKVLKVE